MKDQKKEKQVLLAFFDILGTSKLLNNDEYQKVYEFYSEMIKLCSDSDVPLAIPNRFHPESNADFIVLSFQLHHAFFSDTFLLWVEHDSFLQPTIAGFLEKCCIVFCEALRKGIPLRGVISFGTAIMDDENNLYLGKPLAEAAKAEPKQNWLGIGLGNSITKVTDHDFLYLLPYYNHMKEPKEDSAKLLNGWVLDWPSYWRKMYHDDIAPYISKMNTDERFSGYYRNSLNFVEASKDKNMMLHASFFLHDLGYLVSLCKMGDSIEEEYIIQREQGIEFFIASESKAFVDTLLNIDTSLWLDQTARDALIALQKGNLIIDGNEFPLLSYSNRKV